MDVLINAENRILHITLNRPEKRNALTRQMCVAIVEAVQGAQTRADIACILMGGNGSAFCSGMDLKEDAPVDELLKVHEELFTLGVHSRKPIVMAVNGPALAGGLGLVAQGHIVFATHDASFSLPEIRLGFWPFIVYRAVEAALGARRTLQLSLTGQSFDAEQALAWGLVHQLGNAFEVEEGSKKVATKLARSSPLALELGMQYVQEAAGKSVEFAGEVAASLRAKLMDSDDFREGTAAFREKREPRWPSLKPSAGE